MLKLPAVQPTSLLMKKVLLFTALALYGVAASHASAKSDRSDLVGEVETCEAILQEFMGDPATAIPPSVWHQAHALVITSQFKAGFIFGVKGGYGVILAKKPDGRWSLPVLLTAGEASLGLQVGAKTVETIYVITDERTPRLLFSQRFNIGVDAKAAAGPHAAGTESDTGVIAQAPVLVYGKSAGLYAGATVKAGYIVRNDEDNFTLYSTAYTLPELLYSNWVTPPAEVQPLMNLVQRLAP
jgi:lipid-binding SYLF domain-containing protein